MSDIKILRKHVSIIHSNSDVTILQRKIINALLHEATKEKYKSTEGLVAIDFCMPLSTLSKAINFNSNNTKYLKESIDKLALLTVAWNLLKDKAPENISFLNLRFLQGSPTFYQDGTFVFSFHKFFIDLLNNPSVYGSIDLDVQSWFESKYSHSLYENSTRLVNLQQKYKFIEISVFKMLLGVNDDSYDGTAELTRSIITPALEEVNDRADFLVTIEKVKEGRRVIGFNLSAVKKDKNNKKSSELIELEQGKQEACQEIKRMLGKYFGKINEKILLNIFQNYSEEYILEKMHYTIERAKKETTGLYPIPYFMSALKNDYRSNKIKTLEITAEDLTDNVMKNWENVRDALEIDLAHCRQTQSRYLKSTTDDNILQSAQKMIDDCERKLREHYLKRPAGSSEKSII